MEGIGKKINLRAERMFTSLQGSRVYAEKVTDQL